MHSHSKHTATLHGPSWAAPGHTLLSATDYASQEFSWHTQTSLHTCSPWLWCQLNDTLGTAGGPESLHSQSMEGPKEAAAGLLAALVTAKPQATVESQVAEGQHSQLSLYPPFLRYMKNPETDLKRKPGLFSIP